MEGKMVENQAIVVRNAMKGYTKGVNILDGLNLAVASGSIYGLLGASGCGKTTLLSCIVGVRKLDSGEIWVLGGRPGSKGSGIPGSRVGYMPQEISLVVEFSVINALYYFGRLNGLEDSVIEERYVFLSDLLQLPPRNRHVGSMSGGQQRRVSFAAALIHRPELLILDEPTVGLDPVLRENIWNHLVSLTQDQGTTVVITTHYIEEAKQANRIGLMRSGQLLAESSPVQLLERFQCESLEDAFLTLSRMQKENESRGITGPPGFCSATNQMNDVVPVQQTPYTQNKYQARENRRDTAKIYKALLFKNFLQFIRYPGGLLFAIFLPMLQCLIFFSAIGKEPTGLGVSFVNQEAGNCMNYNYIGNVTYDEQEYTCNLVDVSCRYIREFTRYFPNSIYYDDLPEALRSVKNERTVGVVYFHRNFSRGLQAWIEDGASVETYNIDVGQIKVWQDMGDRQIGLFTKQQMYDAFFDVHHELMRDCRLSPKIADLPVQFKDPIYGEKRQNYSIFMAPVFLLTLIFFLATSVCAAIIITDRHAGVWDRSLVQGVSTGQILITHMLTQMVLLVIQVLVSLCITFLYFEIGCKGSFAIVIVIVVLQGLSGLLYGFLISVFCKSFTMANYISTGSFYPAILLGGCIWPLEGMPDFLRYISYILPTTLPGSSLRAVMHKGYTMDDPSVYVGLLALIVWIVGLTLLCFIGLRRKTN